MKTIKRTGVKGKEITLLVPENKEEARELAKREQSGMLDGRLSFGDGGCVAQLPNGKPSKHKTTTK
jgi:hypothetical protein